MNQSTAHAIIAAAQDHARGEGLHITVAVVDEGGLLVATPEAAVPLKAA
jgi:uncharacterized protein GlcG (DUF336 family)